MFDVSTKLYNEGYKRVNMVVGSDRVNEFKVLLNKYNGKKGRHGFYNFENINVISAGERDPDGEGVSGMSASKMRQAVMEKTLLLFHKAFPKICPTLKQKNCIILYDKEWVLKNKNIFKPS